MPLPTQNRTTEIEVLLNHIPLLVRERLLALKTLAHFLVFVVFPKERIAICIQRHLLILLHVLREKAHLPFTFDSLEANERELGVEKHIKFIHTNAKNAGEGEMAELMNHHEQRQTQNQLKYSNQYRHINMNYLSNYLICLPNRQQSCEPRHQKSHNPHRMVRSRKRFYPSSCLLHHSSRGSPFFLL